MKRLFLLNNGLTGSVPSGYSAIGVSNGSFSVKSSGGQIQPAGTGATGATGPSGESGTSGTSGLSGTMGESGTSGTSGINGTMGESGTSGTTGESGTSGTSGENGPIGEAGTSGTSGENGSIGESGTSGTSGSSGTGFSTISNYGVNRVLTSDNTTNAASANSNLTFNGSVLSLEGDFFINGDINISGSSSTINTENLIVTDPIISIGKSQSGSPSLDEGIFFNRGNEITQALIWDESDDTFAFISTTSSESVIGSLDISEYSDLRLRTISGSYGNIISFTSSSLNIYSTQSGSFKLQDTTQGQGKVLVSDSQGVGTWTSLSSLSGITGSGVSNYIPRWNGTGNLSSTSSIFDDGNKVIVGSYSNFTTQRLFTIGQDTAWVSIGSVPTSTGVAAIYFNQFYPSGGGDAALTGNNTTTSLNATSTVNINTLGVTRLRIISAQTTGSFIGFEFTKPNNTNQTAATPVSGVLFNLGTRQWATGNISTQKEFELTTPTYSFVGSSTISNAYTLYVNAPGTGSNAAIVNNYALGLKGSLFLDADGAGKTLTLRPSSLYASYGWVLSTSNGIMTLPFTLFLGDSSVLVGRFAAGGGNYGLNISPFKDIKLTSQSPANTFFYGSATAGHVGIGTTNPTERLHVSGGNFLLSMATSGNYVKIYEEAGPIHNIESNQALRLQTTTSYINLKAGSGGAIGFSTNGSSTQLLTLNSSNAIGNTTNQFLFNTYAQSGLLASTEVSSVVWNGSTKTWQTGNITNQRWHYIKSNTVSFAASSTITNSYGLYVEKATLGSSVIITNNYALGLDGGLSLIDSSDISVGTSNGTKIGTSTGQKIGFWNTTPVVQPSTSVSSSTLSSNGGTTLTDTDTFDGYTLKQVIKALRNIGILQ